MSDFPVLADQVLFGFVGEFVEEVFPCTEADKVSLASQLLVLTGNLLGRNAHWCVEGSKHFCNLNIVLVGRSGRGRKGSALKWVRNLCKAIDTVYSKNCIKSGLGSGEGLIWTIRDGIQSLKDGGEWIDPGVSDKRLLNIEEEFSSLLKTMSRDGNTLSDVIRSAWDGIDLQRVTKGTEIRASDPHVSIIGHITTQELLKLMATTEMANGFGNRFMWFLVQRSKLLPLGSNVPATFGKLAQRYRELIDFGSQQGEYKFSKDAEELWKSTYLTLEADIPGLVGSLTARASANIRRMAVIYSVLSQETFVSSSALSAAIAMFDYSFKSTQAIFGTSTGDQDIDKALGALRNAQDQRMSRTEISSTVFQRNVTAACLDNLRSRMAKEKLITWDQITHSNGRTEEVWRLASVTKYESIRSS
jgi:hypothetical protein